MNVYILKNDQQLGPFSEEEILRGLTSEAYTLDDPCWREGMAEWQPLGVVFPSRPHEETTVAASSAVEPAKKQDFSESLATLGKMAAKEATLRKLQLKDLNEAFFKLGNAVLAANNAADLECQRLIGEVRRIDGEIDAACKPVATHKSSTFMDKAKGAAIGAKEAATREALKLKRKSVITDIGRRYAESDTASEEFANERLAVNEILQRIKTLRNEIEALQKKSPYSRQLVYAIAFVVVLVIGGFMYSKTSTYFQTRASIAQAEAEARRAQDEIKQDNAKFKAQIAL